MSSESTTTPAFKKDVVSKKKMASYSMGVFIDSFFTEAFGFLVLYYYEVELGLAILLVGLAFVIFAVWNMINDPLVGFLTDRPFKWTKKYGMRMPWVIFGVICSVICFYFLFAVPDFGDTKSNPWPLFWYMVIITCLFDLFYSIFYANYYGAFANIFRTLITNIIVYGDTSTFPTFALVSVVILLIALAILLPGIYENEFVKKRYFQIFEFMESQKLPYFKLLKITFKSRNFVVITVALTLWIMAQILTVSSFLYFIRYVLREDIAALGILSLGFLTIIPAILIFSATTAKKIEHANHFALGIVIMGFGFGSILFATSSVHLFLSLAIVGVGMGGSTCVLLSVVGDTQDEVCLAAGRHVETTLAGIRTFFVRISYISVGVIITGIHLATGFVPGAEQQTPLAIWGIRLHTSVFSMIFCLIAALIVFKFYDLKGDKREAQMAALKKRGL
ncbi:MAG: MFS transporter [Promethearchaeota archaeon]